ncbi:MAG TPA: hypothetical protein VJ576_03445 [Rhodocyclaceae bacterium]|nr:hypothetical protein [Rhodocyclaceae bacterium]
MFEAYKVAVRLSLINNVSSGLLAISSHFMKTGKDAEALQARLEKLRKITLLGTAASATGAFGLGMIGKALKPAEDYVHQLNIMNMAGMKQAEIAEAVSDAWKLAGENMTTTATGNLKALLDLRNVTGNWHEAREFLPIMQRMQTVLAASKEGSVGGHATDLAFSAMKALDIRGAVNDPEVLKRQADYMTRVIIGTQGRVTPEMFQSVFNYARQAKFSLSDDFAYKYLPTLMLENATKGGGGGGSKGVGPALAALYRLTNQGFVNRQSLPLLKELGLVGNGQALPTSTPGTVVAPLKGADLAAKDSFTWTNQVVVPQVLDYLKRHKMEASDQNVLQILNMISRGNQLAGGLLGEFYIKRKNFERDRLLMEGVMSPAEAYKNAMTKDPDTARRALHAAWENFETSLTVNVVPVVVPALLKLSRGLNDIGDFARKHPNLTKDLVIGFGAISGVLAVGGPLITGLAMTRLAFGDLGGVLGKGSGLAGNVSSLAGGLKAFGLAVTPLLAMLAVKNWAEDQTHDKERVDTLKGWSDTVKGWMPSWMGDPSKRSVDRYMAARRELDGTADYAPGSANGGQRQVVGAISRPAAVTTPQGSNYVAPRQQQPIQVSSTINLDGRKVAEVVTDHQYRDAQRPTAGVSRFDGRMTPTPVGSSGRW